MINKTNAPTLDIVGVGNAIVDVLTTTDDSLLEDLSFKKGSMTLIDENKAKELYEMTTNRIQKSGGSVANSLACVAQIGGKAAFIGRVRDDNLGKIFTEEMSTTRTIFKTPPLSVGPSTARCLIFVTPDAQRTMCTYLGASVLLEPKDIDLTAVKEAKILYLEGYLWDNPAAKNAFIKAAEIAKNAGRKVALSLSDSFCVSRHRESFIKLVGGTEIVVDAVEKAFNNKEFQWALQLVDRLIFSSKELEFAKKMKAKILREYAEEQINCPTRHYYIQSAKELESKS